MTTAPRLNLVVVRSPDMESSRRFFETLGLKFKMEKHGDGPQHYACELGDVVFEIYPQDGGPEPVSSGTRLGFVVESIDETTERLTQLGVELLSPPRESKWGRRAVVAGPDGHRIELADSP